MTINVSNEQLYLQVLDSQSWKRSTESNLSGFIIKEADNEASICKVCNNDKLNRQMFAAFLL